MSLYPSLEDMKVDQMAEAQVLAAKHAAAAAAAAPAYAAYGLPAPASLGGLYGGLGLEELGDYGGLNISEAAIQAAMPGDVGRQVVAYQQQMAQRYKAPITSITPVGDLNMARAEIRQGVREVVLAKDGAGKLGVAVEAIDKGLFVAFVWRDSAAALAGLHVGDQILQIDGATVAGWTSKNANEAFKKADPKRVALAVRDRPMARVVVVVKDHQNQIGFLFKNGMITAIVKDSSAARNGMLIHHHLCEINGQNVMMLKDTDVLRIIQEAPRSVSVTIMPTFVYEHLMKHIGSSLKKHLDHSIPEL